MSAIGSNSYNIYMRDAAMTGSVFSIRNSYLSQTGNTPTNIYLEPFGGGGSYDLKGEIQNTTFYLGLGGQGEHIHSRSPNNGGIHTLMSNNVFYSSNEQTWMWTDEGPAKIYLDGISDNIGTSQTLNGGFIISTATTAVISGGNFLADPSVWIL